MISVFAGGLWALAGYIGLAVIGLSTEALRRWWNWQPWEWWDDD